MYTLLNSLPMSYDPLVMTLEGYEGRLEIAQVTQRLLQEEYRRKAFQPQEELVLISSTKALSVKGSRKEDQAESSEGWKDNKKKV